MYTQEECMSAPVILTTLLYTNIQEKEYQYYYSLEHLSG